MRITKADLDADNFYNASVSLEVTGGVTIEANLGTVRFKGWLSATTYIFAEAGSGIKAGEGIEAGEGIKAGWGIEAGEGIKAGWGIEAGRGICARFVFSFTFDVSAKWLKTSCLPFWRKFWAAMPPLKKFAEIIMDESNCWPNMREAVTKDEAVEICKWEGWHPILRAQLEMFFQLKDKVEL